MFEGWNYLYYIYFILLEAKTYIHIFMCITYMSLLEAKKKKVDGSNEN